MSGCFIRLFKDMDCWSYTPEFGNSNSSFSSQAVLYARQLIKWMNLLLGIILWSGVNNLFTKYSLDSSQLLTLFWLFDVLNADLLEYVYSFFRVVNLDSSLTQATSPTSQPNKFPFFSTHLDTKPDYLWLSLELS